MRLRLTLVALLVVGCSDMGWVATTAESQTPAVELLDGMDTWWSLPRAVTFEGHIYTGGIDDAGVARVASTREHDDVFTLGTFAVDDHTTPAFVVEDGKPPLVAYAGHSVDSLIRYRKGTTPGDLTTLGSEQSVSGTSGKMSYAQWWHNGDDVWLIGRDGQFDLTSTRWVFFKSTNFGTSFGSRVELLNEQYGYMGSVQVDSTVRVAVAKHPTAADRRVWYFEVNLNTGSITKSDGTVIGNLDGTNLPLSAAALELAYTAPSGHGLRLMAISTRVDGGPEIGVATWTSDTNTVYRHIDFDGGSWTATTVVAAGDVIGFTPSVHYNAGIAFLDPTDGGEMLVAREASGTWYLERYILDGGSWVVAETIEQSSSYIIARPWPSVGGGYVYNRVDTYPDFSTYTNARVVVVRQTEFLLGDLVVSETTANLEPSPGNSIRASREDHTHGSQPSGGGGGSIDDLTDVDTTTTTPVAGDVLEWDGSNWVPAEPSSGGGVGELLISDTPSTPLVFADLLQNEAQDDLVYSD